jgi:hypothetical protein
MQRPGARTPRRPHGDLAVTSVFGPHRGWIATVNRKRRERAARSYFLEAIADTIERLDHIELDVACPELYAQPLDVAVDGPVVHILLIVIGCCAAFDAFDDRMFACLVVPN